VTVLIPGVSKLLNEAQKLDELTDTVQEMIYKVRWVDSFGKNGKLATDREIAQWVVAVFHQSDLYNSNQR
jgi:hypothetical protein